ncbi:hypothetical protein RVS70_05215 [Virgibacillus sp. M23]|nr:hypothetical protein [Virgibacillus sp. M23]MDY7043600.1 hypothetical protein [Virgibacillus sp. M23]
MEIWTNEWNEKVKENYTFPSMISVYCASNDRIMTEMVNTISVEPNNLK